MEISNAEGNTQFIIRKQINFGDYMFVLGNIKELGTDKINRLI